jgi:hypothetical protein
VQNDENAIFLKSLLIKPATCDTIIMERGKGTKRNPKNFSKTFKNPLTIFQKCDIISTQRER